MKHESSWRWKVIIAFAAVYIIWGSTYLAIRVGVQQLPPALFAGSRFVVAGLLLALYARLSGQKFPTHLREWRTIAITALWLAGFGTLGTHGQKLSPQTVLGLAVGFFGVAMLMMPERGFSLTHFGAQLAVFAACPLWAAGSRVAKRGRLTTPPLMVAAMQSLFAGLVFCGIGFPLGEAARWNWSPEAMAALAFLIVFGSCFGYASYIWLLHEVSPSILGTYAYINPLVAVVLGWLVLQETLNANQLAGMVVILLGGMLVSIARPKAIAAPSQST